MAECQNALRGTQTPLTQNIRNLASFQADDETYATPTPVSTVVRAYRYPSGLNTSVDAKELDILVYDVAEVSLSKDNP